MPLLLMDLDAVAAVQEKMQQTSNNLEQIVTSLNTQVQTMIGKDWVSPGAQQFLLDYQAWARVHQELTQLLDQNRQRLVQEITEWQDEAQFY